MKKRGRGMAAIGYPTGVYAGGDANEAQISLKMDGTFNLLMGTVELGQACKTVFSQIAAQELDVPIGSITYINSDTDIAPYCAGAFASRATFMGGNAVIMACRDLKDKIKKFTAPILGVKPDDLEAEDNKILMKGNPDKSMTMAEIGAASTFGGTFLVGIGSYSPGGPYPIDPATGEQPFVAAVAFATAIMEVEVDTETGVVEVVKSVYVYEIGKALSPLMCKMQINGGSAMGIGMAISENVYPYWPSMDFAVDNLGDYVLVTATDIPADNQHAIIEIPHPNGPYGAKGFGEMVSNVQIPAITAAIHDAIGVWITRVPITPEAILKALESKKEAV